MTTHSHLLPYDEVKEVQDALKFEDGTVKSFLLHNFDTELHFSSKVGLVISTFVIGYEKRYHFVQKNLSIYYY